MKNYGVLPGLRPMTIIWLCMTIIWLCIMSVSLLNEINELKKSYGSGQSILLCITAFLASPISCFLFAKRLQQRAKTLFDFSPWNESMDIKTLARAQVEFR